MPLRPTAATRVKILDRVAKLERLAESPNEHEAARARQLADAFKKKYAVDEDELHAFDEKQRTKCRDGGPLEGDTYWQEQLAFAVGRLYGCRALKAQGRLFFEGLDGTSADALALYRRLAREVEDACAARWQAQADPKVFEGPWCSVFRAEAVATITAHLTLPKSIEELRREVKREVQQDVHQILRQERDVVDWLKRFVSGYASSCMYLAVERAHIEGRQAGVNICLARPERTLT